MLAKELLKISRQEEEKREKKAKKDMDDLLLGIVASVKKEMPLIYKDVRGIILEAAKNGMFKETLDIGYCEGGRSHYGTKYNLHYLLKNKLAYTVKIHLIADKLVHLFSQEGFTVSRCKQIDASVHKLVLKISWAKRGGEKWQN